MRDTPVLYCPVCGDTCPVYPDLGAISTRCIVCGHPMLLPPEPYTYSDYLFNLELFDSEGNKITGVEDKIRYLFVRPNPLYDPRMEEKADAQFHKLRTEGYSSFLFGTRPSVLTCPTCGSHKVSSIGALERGASVAMLGLFSKKINKSFKCGSCGYTW